MGAWTGASFRFGTCSRCAGVAAAATRIRAISACICVCDCAVSARLEAEVDADTLADDCASDKLVDDDEEDEEALNAPAEWNCEAAKAPAPLAPAVAVHRRSDAWYRNESPFEVQITGEGVIGASALPPPGPITLPHPLMLLPTPMWPMPLPIAPLPLPPSAGNVRKARTSFAAACGGKSSITEHSSASDSVAILYMRRSPLDKSSSKYCAKRPKKRVGMESEVEGIERQGVCRLPMATKGLS